LVYEKSAYAYVSFYKKSSGCVFKMQLQKVMVKTLFINLRINMGD